MDVENLDHLDESVEVLSFLQMNVENLDVEITPQLYLFLRSTQYYTIFCELI